MKHSTLIRSPRMTNSKRAANRANAARSTGPRTAAGKRRSSLNALKHGVFAQSFYEAMKVFGEDPAEFDRLHRGFIVSFDPQTPFEAALVEDLARQWWKKQRVDRGEDGLRVRKVEKAQVRRLHELSDVNEAPMRESRETILEIGLMRAGDCHGKFDELTAFLEAALKLVERKDPEFDAEGLIRLLYGTQPTSRGNSIRLLAEDLRAAEARAADEEAANQSSAGADDDAATPSSEPDGVNGASQVPDHSDPLESSQPGDVPGWAEAETADLQSSIENRQAWDGDSNSTDPQAASGKRPADDEPDDDFSPRVLRAGLASELVREWLEVNRQYEQFIQRHIEYSPVSSDACLAPSGQKWNLSLRVQDHLERTLERKLRQLRMLQSADGWGARLRRINGYVPPRPNRYNPPTPNGAGYPRPVRASSRTTNPESRNPSPAHWKHEKCQNEPTDVLHNKGAQPENEPQTNWERTPNEVPGMANEVGAMRESGVASREGKIEIRNSKLEIRQSPIQNPKSKI